MEKLGLIYLDVRKRLFEMKRKLNNCETHSVIEISNLISDIGILEKDLVSMSDKVGDMIVFSKWKTTNHRFQSLRMSNMNKMFTSITKNFVYHEHSCCYFLARLNGLFVGDPGFYLYHSESFLLDDCVVLRKEFDMELGYDCYIVEGSKVHATSDFKRALWCVLQELDNLDKDDKVDSFILRHKVEQAFRACDGWNIEYEEIISNILRELKDSVMSTGGEAHE